MNPYIIDSDSLNMNPQVDSFDSRGKRSIQGSKCSNSSPTFTRSPLVSSLPVAIAYSIVALSSDLQFEEGRRDGRETIRSCLCVVG